MIITSHMQKIIKIYPCLLKLSHKQDKILNIGDFSTIMLYRVHLTWERFKLTMLVVIGIDCIGSYKSNYHTITMTDWILIKFIHKLNMWTLTGVTKTRDESFLLHCLFVQYIWK
jgi:hypothetical protein